MNSAVRVLLTSLALIVAAGVTPAVAQYRYSGGGYGGGEGKGFLVLLEPALQNPRNTDSVVATLESGLLTQPVLPDWDDEAGGRIGLGYRFDNGTKVMLTGWTLEADQQAAGTGPAGGTAHFGIGPAFPDGSGGYFGNRGVPGTFDILTEIEAQTGELTFSIHQGTDTKFSVEWLVGIRAARFEETMQGTYDQAIGFDPGSGAINAAKFNEGSMAGVLAGARMWYQFNNDWSLTGKASFSLLDGEVEAVSQLTPTGLVSGAPVQPNRIVMTDDGRSGSIRDIDLAVVWHGRGQAIKVWLGWEQSLWEEIAADLVRNTPGSSAPLRERDSVTFSGYKLGVLLTF